LVVVIQCSQMMYDRESDFKLNGPYSNDTWQSYSADRKMQMLLTSIYADTRMAEWPGTLEKTELFIESMKTSFDFEGDDFPKQGPLDLLTRKKLIHSVGVIVRVEYVSLTNIYTGIFQGCKNALLRFSSATPVDTDGGESAMAPGLGLKFLRDGVPSSNTFAMYSLVGQPSYNFFAHDLTNHVPELSKDGPLPVQLLRQRFLTASEYATFAGLWKLANYDEHGRAANKIAFPFRLHLHPNLTLHNSFSDSWTGVEYEEQLMDAKKGIQVGSTIYDVYAQNDPFSEQLTLIGKLVAKARPTTSKFADKTLFFQHTRFEEDLAYYPSWETTSRDIMAKQRDMSGSGYHFPDLAWK